MKLRAQGVGQRIGIGRAVSREPGVAPPPPFVAHRHGDEIGEARGDEVSHAILPPVREASVRVVVDMGVAVERTEHVVRDFSRPNRGIPSARSDF